MKRILITGSRRWTDAATIKRALLDAIWDLGAPPRNITVVHGDCHLGGADILAAEIAEGVGMTVEPHPAERGPRGEVLGPKRNAHMVSLGADLCLAFPDPKSRGTFDCMKKAENAGIPVRNYGTGRTA